MKYLAQVVLYLTFLSINAQKPNIVFVLADDLGYTDLGCYGNPFNETPHIDALAKEGRLFRQAYASSPVCSPSRAAILTGKHPARLKLTNYLVGRRVDSTSTILPPDWKTFLPTEEITLAERLKTLDYKTGFVGKWHLGNGKGQNPWEQGFDYSRMIGKNGLDYYNYGIWQDSFESLWEDDGTHYLTDKLTQYGVEFIHRQKEPFFLYMCFSAPHVLIIPRGDKLKKYLFKYNAFNGEFNPYYAAMLESLDEGVGQLVNALKEKGEWENTIFVFTSDNGGVGLDELGPVPTNLFPLRKWKGHAFEGGIRVPTMICWPAKIPTALDSTTVFNNVDYSESILGLLNNSLDISLDGRDLSKTILGEKDAEQEPLFWHYPHFSNQLGRPAAAVRYGDYKLIRFFEDNNLELYNISKDLGERTDLSQSEPEKLKMLDEMLSKWFLEVDAQMPLEKDGY